MKQTQLKSKVAIIGSRSLTDIDIKKHLPKECREIISGGAKGVDSIAADFSMTNGIKLTVILPQYEKYGRGAPIVRNKQIVDSADMVIAFWDGKSRGTLSVIEYCKKQKKEFLLINMGKKSDQTTDL